MGGMYLTVKKRLDLLINTEDKIRKRVLVFDPKRSQFGFRHMQQMFPVDLADEIKGIPTVAYNNHTDHMKFAIKVIPLENRYEREVHPSQLEVKYLKEFTGLVRNFNTPHIGYYFDHFQVQNNCKALTCFPLKEFRRELYKDTLVLVAEFVSGGSLEEWIQTDETAVIADGVWKYIIFSVIWTLYILQDKYRLVHADMHFGNILIDTCISTQDKGPLEYRLSVDGKDRVFHVPSLGVLCKAWDCEFARAYKGMDGVYPNRFGAKEDNIPNYFNPVYDLHCFLVSLLELNIPTSVKDFIQSVYPPELIPEPPARRHRSFGDRSESSSGYESDVSTASGSDIAVDDDFSLHSDDYSGDEHRHTGDSDECFWKTDEAMDTSVHTEDGADDMNLDGEGSDGDYSDEEDSDGSQIRTEFLLGERMLNGTETKFPGLPTPYSLLHHPYFDEYLAQPAANGKVRKPSVSFKWETKYDASLDASKTNVKAEAKADGKAKASAKASGKAAGGKTIATAPTIASEKAPKAGKTHPATGGPLAAGQVMHPSVPAHPVPNGRGKPVLKPTPPLSMPLAAVPDGLITGKARGGAHPMPIPAPAAVVNGTRKKAPVLRTGPTPPKARR